ncbi:T9SS type A sorting domain-containing protein [Phaeocystidibacter luteus]|uniref:T9SS type A sorting domain-containing protein n=1 Tax=Phaeocystidibacter luteus TaxID=911197 RepID=UPI00147913FC|nr:T9SS type A sorting domain-containing protein [Phaeocystidibacter luteus]
MTGNTQIANYSDGSSCRYWNVRVFNDNGTPNDPSDDILLACGTVWEAGCPPSTGVSLVDTDELSDGQFYGGIIVEADEENGIFEVLVTKIGSGYAEGMTTATMAQCGSSKHETDNAVESETLECEALYNPDGQTYIRVNKNSTCEFVNTAGQVVGSLELNSGINDLSSIGLTKGVYIARVSTLNEEFPEELVIKVSIR